MFRNSIHANWFLLMVFIINVSGLLSLQAQESLHFRNGDALFGTFEGMPKNDRLRWKHPSAVKVMEMKTGNVAEIHFDSDGVESMGSPVGACEVLFTNGDAFRGQIESFDGTNFVFETTFAGKVSANREAVKLVRFSPEDSEPVFEGPEGLEGWTMGDVKVEGAGIWKYAKGGFYANKAASIARIVGMPDSSSLEFDMAWKDTFNLAIALYTDYLQPVSLRDKDIEPNFGGFYSLQLNPRSANVLLVTKGIPLQFLGQQIMNQFDRKNQAHVEIKCSKTQNIIALYVDGALVRQWKDPNGFNGQGRGIRLVHQGNGSVRLRNIKVRQWDGRFDLPPSLPSNATSDLVVLPSMSAHRVSLGSIKDGKAFVQGGNLLPEVELDLISQIELGPAHLKTNRVNGISVKAWFNDTQFLTLGVKRIEDGTMKAVSPNMGEVELDMKYVPRLSFE